MPKITINSEKITTTTKKTLTSFKNLLHTIIMQIRRKMQFEKWNLLKHFPHMKRIFFIAYSNDASLENL